MSFLSVSYEEDYMTRPTGEAIKVKMVTLHTPFHLAGASFQQKIDVHGEKKGLLVVEYFRQDRDLHVTFKGQTAILPSSNVASMVVDDGNPADRGGPSSRLPNPLAVDNTSHLRERPRGAVDPMGTGRKLADPPPPAVAAAQDEQARHFATQTTPQPSDYELARGDPAGQVFAGPGAVPVKAPKYTKVNK
jgi:hypothetical protein